MEDGLANLVADERELEDFKDSPAALNALFSIKEAIYKAVNPLDGIFLDFRDVSVDRRRGIAITNYGRRVNWRVALSSRVLAVAWIPKVEAEQRSLRTV
jgi:4'-phosphopantetheinyl transferase EntD